MINVYSLSCKKGKDTIVVGVYATQKDAETAAGNFPMDVWVDTHSVIGTRGEFTPDQLGEGFSKTGYKNFSD